MAVNLHQHPLRASCGFYLFDHYFVFFSYWRVDATVECKTGPVWYRGPFSFERRPARFVDFVNTGAISAAFDAALKSRSEVLSLAHYKRMAKKGDPVVQELELRNRTELGRRADYFQLSEFENWLRVSRLPLETRTVLALGGLGEDRAYHSFKKSRT